MISMIVPTDILPLQNTTYQTRSGARAQNRLDAARTDALVPQPENGKIRCVRLPCCGSYHRARAQFNAELWVWFMQ